MLLKSLCLAFGVGGGGFGVIGRFMYSSLAFSGGSVPVEKVFIIGPNSSSGLIGNGRSCMLDWRRSCHVCMYLYLYLSSIQI